MTVKKKSGRKLVVRLVVLGLLAAGGAAVWVERTPLLVWCYIHQLSHASDGDRAAWADRVAGLGDAAVPTLVDCLKQPDAAVCDNARAGLEKLTGPWAADEPRTAALVRTFAAEYPRLSPAGRKAALETAAGWFVPVGAPPEELTAAAVALVRAATPASEGDAHGPALDLCAAMLDRAESGDELLAAAKELVHVCLGAELPADRLRAVRLAVHPGVDAADQVVALLNDPAAEVRRAAVLAVGPASSGVLDDSLLPSLHDADAEVRRLAEEALRRDRRFSADQLQVSRLLTHPDPLQRLNVLDYLRPGAGLEPGLWLRRLSHDPSPSVRLAAVRVMSQQEVVDLGDRIDQMADADPSPTVSQAARRYQKWRKAAPPVEP
jgi:hypothetical protein